MEEEDRQIQEMVMKEVGGTMTTELWAECWKVFPRKGEPCGLAKQDRDRGVADCGSETVPEIC